MVLTMPVSPVANRLFKYIFRAITLAAWVIAVAGCSETGTTSQPDDNSADGSTNNGLSSVFDGSDVINERFGTLTSRNTNPEIDSASQTMVVTAMNDFSLNLHRIVADGAPDDGSVESGYSATVALSLAYAGTSGDTQVALANLLGVDGIPEPSLHAGQNALALALNSRNNEDLVLHTTSR